MHKQKNLTQSNYKKDGLRQYLGLVIEEKSDFLLSLSGNGIITKIRPTRCVINKVMKASIFSENIKEVQ